MRNGSIWWLIADLIASMAWCVMLIGLIWGGWEMDGTAWLVFLAVSFLGIFLAFLEIFRRRRAADTLQEG
ncbi:hypothetical protein [Sphingomonas sp.]|uniref:hypothetical protein n=1 Tax=Sphingomonas sp. TaxID=28214 RepID=UPI003BAD4442